EYANRCPLYSAAPPLRNGVQPYGAPGLLAAFSAQSWVNLGPTDAAFEWNGSQYPAVDSGRVSGISVNPTDATEVIIGTSGGGLWKTNNFGAANPTWTPIG